MVLLRADITTLTCDAIVNAANSQLAGGGGVDGAIHRAGGGAIMRELNQLYHGCATGDAVITGAGRLPCRQVIHAVGPRYRDGQHDEDALLASAYRAAFTLASENDCTTVTSASLATGIYGFPVERAAPIALAEAAAALRGPGTPLREIAWALFNDSDLAVYRAALAAADWDATGADPRLTVPGAISYLHIPASDTAAAARFYQAVFGWTVRDHDTPRPSFDDGGGHLSGAFVTDQEVSSRPGLLPYIYVSDIASAVRNVTEHGGEIVEPPHQEGTLRIATFRDPAGNVMGMWQETAG